MVNIKEWNLFDNVELLMTTTSWSAKYLQTQPKIFEETMSAEDKYKYQAASSTSGNQRFQIKKVKIQFPGLYSWFLFPGCSSGRGCLHVALALHVGCLVLYPHRWEKHYYKMQSCHCVSLSHSLDVFVRDVSLLNVLGCETL